MELAKVIGQVVSTVRCPGLPYNSLLLVDLLNEKGESIGRSQVAADPIARARANGLSCPAAVPHVLPSTKMRRWIWSLSASSTM